MTRYHFFNFLYPQQAAKISEGYADIGQAFTKVTGLNKLTSYFRFTPRDWDRPKVDGIDNTHDKHLP